MADISKGIQDFRQQLTNIDKSAANIKFGWKQLDKLNASARDFLATKADTEFSVRQARRLRAQKLMNFSFFGGISFMLITALGLYFWKGR